MALHFWVVDGGGIHYLDLHVLEGEHPGQRYPGGEGVGGHFGVRTRERGNELRFAGVGLSDEHRLARPFLADRVGRWTPRATLRIFQFLQSLGDPGPQVGPEMVGPFVFRGGGQHLLKGRGLLSRTDGRAVRFFGNVVLGRQIRRHGKSSC